jgi:DNA polymerase III subunit delta'
MGTLLSDIIGHERALESLRSACASDRIHHAWVFAGPRGVGKRTTAVAFGALLLDPTTAPDLAGELAPEPGSHCQRLIEAGNHPDFAIITKEQAALSEDADIRNRKQTTIPKQVLVERLIEPSTLAGSDASKGARARRVFVVDEAELMGPPYGNNPAQNALLKTLEEPPPGVVIILVTSDENRLLPTIRSRCQRVTFGRLTGAEMERWRAERAGDDVRALGDDAWSWVKRFADGSPGVATLASETGLASWADEIEPALARLERGAFVADFGKNAHDLADDWAKRWVKAREKAGDNQIGRASCRERV